MANINCSKCHGTGVIKESNGVIHTCFDCLINGDMDQHDGHLKDSNVRI